MVRVGSTATATPLPAAPGAADGAEHEAWAEVRDQIRARGLRWTPQRRLILEVLEETRGHVTGSEIVEACRKRDRDTTPSTVYRTLDVLEELGYISHSHSAGGREEFHVMPAAQHAHLQCRTCGRTWELDAEDAMAIVRPIRRRFRFEPDVGHLSVTGQCADCRAPKLRHSSVGHRARLPVTSTDREGRIG